MSETSPVPGSVWAGNREPRIAVVGCGALGSFYGARLVRAGRRVHFLLRSDFEAVRDRGVRIRSSDGEYVAHPEVARRPEEIGVCDLVLIGLKTTANGEFERLLGPLIGEGTVVLTLQNGLGNEEALAALWGGERVMGGLCFVCLNRLEPGLVVHLAHGRIVMGEFGRAAGPRARRIADWLRESGTPCDVVDDLERAHWEKLVWNIAFNGLGVASVAGLEGVHEGRLIPGRPRGRCLPTDALLGDSDWERLVREVMLEVIAAARAQGLEVPESTAEEQMQRTREMGTYKASTLIDYERGLPLEVESLFGEPLRRARAAGVAVPRLTALYAVIRALDPGART